MWPALPTGQAWLLFQCGISFSVDRDHQKGYGKDLRNNSVCDQKWGKDQNISLRVDFFFSRRRKNLPWSSSQQLLKTKCCWDIYSEGNWVPKGVSTAHSGAACSFFQEGLEKQQESLAKGEHPSTPGWCGQRYRQRPRRFSSLPALDALTAAGPTVPFPSGCFTGCWGKAWALGSSQARFRSWLCRHQYNDFRHRTSLLPLPDGGMGCWR